MPARNGETPPPHPLGDERPFILSDGTANLQEQLVVRVLAHRPIQELDLTPRPLELIDQDYLMHVVARQAIGRGDHEAIKFTRPHHIAQTVKGRAFEVSPTVTIVTKDAILAEGPALLVNILAKTVQLLLDGLHLDLRAGRHPDIHCYTHGIPPESIVGRGALST